MEFVVDGYNLMWTSQVLNPVARFNFSLARKLLTKMLSAYSKASGNRITLVLDGYKGKFPYTQITTENGIEVVVTASGVNADRWIMENALRDGYNATIVSSDREIVNFARAKSIPLMTSKTFENRVMAKIRKNKALMDEVYNYSRFFRRRHKGRR